MFFFKNYSNEPLIVGMENTGEYNNFLYTVLEQYTSFAIKKSIGLTRGKNDRIDAIRIAQFIEKNHSELTE